MLETGPFIRIFLKIFGWLADRICQLTTGFAEFKRETQNPANRRLTFKITADMRLKCNNDYVTEKMYII